VPLAYSAKSQLRSFLCFDTKANKTLSFPESEDVTLMLMLQDLISFHF